MKNWKEEERRKYKRITKHFILTYFDLDHPEKRYSASQLKNISLGGMCLITEYSFTPGIRLGIELKTPFFTGLTRLEGLVLESHERLKDVIYETRLKFGDLSEDTKKVLGKTIEFFHQQESEDHEQN